MRIGDWSSDVCSSALLSARRPRAMAEKPGPRLLGPQATPAMIARVVDTMGSVRPDGYTQAVNMLATGDVKDDVARLADTLPLEIIYGSDDEIGRASCRERVWQYV